MITETIKTFSDDLIKPPPQTEFANPVAGVPHRRKHAARRDGRRVGAFICRRTYEICALQRTY